MKIPRSITGPFASLLGGEWASHRTADAAWARVWGHQDEPLAVVEVTAHGRGTSLPEPASRPYGTRSGSPGKTVLAQRKVYATAEEFEAQDRLLRAAGFRSWSDWARGILAAAR